MTLYDHTLYILAGITTGLTVFKFGPKKAEDDASQNTPRPNPDLIPTWAAFIPAALALILFSLRSFFIR